DQPATLVWAEALDGGDAGVEAAERDRVFELAAPFTGEPAVLATLGLRYGGVLWSDDQLAIVSEWWWKTRQTRTWRLWPGTPGKAPKLLHERSFEDRYADPGRPLTRSDERARQVLRTTADGHGLYLVGDGASTEGDRPFLGRFDLTSGESTRLFHSAAPFYERPIELLDAAGHRLLVRRESRDDPPNYFLRDLQTGELRQITHFPHPAPQLRGVPKELVRYQRGDGVDLTGTLYLPPGYQAKENGPLPLLLWVYPREFKSAEAAGQVTDSPYRFDRISWYSAMLWVSRGYAVLDDPSMPIVGEGEIEPNDTYVAQLVTSAEAAIDEMVRRGVAERGRIAIGGHSYGAFTTANLLAHSDLFAAGIAMSGAYNRTLTPFGFQSEERTLWQAPEIYVGMSPFLFADRINEPLLLVHGEADNNPGTFPMQSERFFSALQGLGATTRLVMLPEESHGYRARESVLHMLWEVDRWLETWVKNAQPTDPPRVEGVVVE
ncbi:MAG: S9 family peptidase, partial [Thermoanaerobaculia bacterium]|nr:S9 family peptidase [Thermoanaerobaculia bacterium]